jgi:thermitase
VKSNSDTSDVLGHGTAVAGVIAAAGNNGIGVAGVSWQSRLMPLVVVDENDLAAYSNIAEAIQYAADRGVRVINISIGGATQSPTLQSAVDYAWSKGALIFASAMNNSASVPYYPAACNHVMAVSATDSNDRLASFSNYGNWIAISAPGTSILTTTNGGGYAYWFGTSFSSPIVAGVAALSLAVNPSLTNAELWTILEKSADDIGPPGYGASFGWGRVNAFTAVTAAWQALFDAEPLRRQGKSVEGSLTIPSRH